MVREARNLWPHPAASRRTNDPEAVTARSDTERDIIETLGQVPEFFKQMPDETLADNWNEFKRQQLTDTALSVREKQLIGLGVAAATHCPYCTYFHQSAAKMMGASDAQCEEASRFAAETAKYSAYLHGLQVDLPTFKRQTDEIGAHLAKKAEEASRKAA